MGRRGTRFCTAHAAKIFWGLAHTPLVLPTVKLLGCAEADGMKSFESFGHLADRDKNGTVLLSSYSTICRPFDIAATSYIADPHWLAISLPAKTEAARVELTVNP
jgi:hypothetical protein